MSPVERARTIIEKCAHPSYKEQLTNYLDEAIEKVGGHTPHMLEKAFAMHTNLKENGTMHLDQKVTK